MLAFGKSHQLFKGFCAQVMLDLAGIVGSNGRVHTQCNKKAGQLFVAAINPAISSPGGSRVIYPAPSIEI